MPTEPKSSSRARAVRSWAMGALFVWTLTGAVAFAAFSSRGATSGAVALEPEVASPSTQNLFVAPAPIAARSEVKSQGKGIVW